MEGDAKDKTGMRRQLAKECVKISKRRHSKGPNSMGIQTMCALNMGKEISRYHRDIGGDGFDFMSFQEASNADELGLNESGITMKEASYGAAVGFDHEAGPLKGQPKRAWVVTLYNEARVGAHDAKAEGDLQWEKGRPFLALVFDKVKIIFANVHNVRKVRHQWQLTSFPNEINASLAKAFAEKPERKSYRVIMAGDFNDEFGNVPGFKLPWNGAVMKLKAPMIKSCCTTDAKAKPKEYGDYIFDSAGPAVNRFPKAFDNSVSRSDHWPVEAVLTG